MSKLRRIFEDATKTAGTVPVLVSLRMPSPDAAVLDQLRVGGLQIARVIGNTLLGSIDAARLPQLRLNEAVADVETSVKLKPHSAAPPESSG